MKYCPICGSKNLTYVNGKKEFIEVRNEKIEVYSDSSIDCNNCSESFSTIKSEYELVIKAQNIYRDKYNIPYPQEIKTFIAKYNLSYRDFEKLTGIGTKTIHRYIKGEIPDKSMATLIRMLISFPEFVIKKMATDEYFKKAKFKNIKFSNNFYPHKENNSKQFLDKLSPWKQKESVKWKDNLKAANTNTKDSLAA